MVINQDNISWIDLQGPWNKSYTIQKMHLVKKPKHEHKFCASWTNCLMNHRCLKQKWKDLRALAKAKLCPQSINKWQIVVIPFQNMFFTKWYCNHQIDDDAIRTLYLFHLYQLPLSSSLEFVTWNTSRVFGHLCSVLFF